MVTLSVLNIYTIYSDILYTMIMFNTFPVNPLGLTGEHYYMVVVYVLFFFFRVFHIIFSHLRAHAFARSVTVARSSAVYVLRECHNIAAPSRRLLCVQ